MTTLNKPAAVIKFLAVLCIAMISTHANAQRDPAYYNEPDEEISQKGFHAGLYIGTYFANNISAKEVAEMLASLRTFNFSAQQRNNPKRR